MKNKALFLDRDGIINEDKAYVYRKEDIDFVEGIFDVIRTFVSKGFMPVIVTNQSGIGRGLYSEADFAALSRWMQSQFDSAGLPAIPVYYCPHHPTEGIGQYRQQCDCRKPEPGMLLTAIAEHHIDASRSFMIGDSWRDIQAADAAGVGHKIFVSPGDNENSQPIDNVTHVNTVSHILSTDVIA
ncbi:D-glycero-alpha-D-manno-heptose-1,7-bisphosphate 7-phosphatase [Alteromonas antoniana]|uniref:D-glycero-alpha-D-manno-heptose-1,7-bisphosphate 7-phosphatase n=1 Tax=Alteromonas antoniana TaxID=2803813 RepID=UPI001C46B743